MKKIVASVGLVALGAAGIQSVSAQDLTAPDNSKPWSVSATLRGFYDDNTGTVPNNVSVHGRDSFGFEVSPSAALVWSMEQTTVNLGVLYSLKYYDTKPPSSTDHTDQSFTFNAGLTHAFSDQTKIRVSDSFVIGQEPDMLRAGDTFATFQRLSGDNIRNYGSIGADVQLTPVLGLGLGYDNAFYDYDQSRAGAGPDTLVFDGTTFATANPVIPSYSGLLDRIEHRAHIEGLYQLAPETKLLLGYRFMEIDYTGNEAISGYVQYPLTLVKSSARDSREHSAYVGAQHNFAPDLTGAVRVGASYTDYFNDDSQDAVWTPFVNATLKYTYAPESYVEGGVSYDRNATDVTSLYNNGSFTLDAQSGVIYASIVHRIDPRLFVSLMLQFQNSTYNGGYADGKSEQFYLAGIDLQYKFNQYFSGHIGYNYDRLESDLNRTFDRNRVYIGVTASY